MSVVRASLCLVFTLFCFAEGFSCAQADELDAVLGRALFERIWVAAPASTQATDGLGPLFNARSCARCHPKAGRGVLELKHETDIVDSPALVLQLSNDPVYGLQLQTNSIHGHAAEARVKTQQQISRVSLSDNTKVVLTKLIYQPFELAYGDLQADTRLSARIAPPLHGLAWIEQIPDAAILRYADPDDRDGDGISGRANRLDAPQDSPQLGRFGWKASLPSLLEQTAQALALDMGLSSPLRIEHAGDCTAAQPVCRDAIHGDSQRFEGFELSTEMVMLIVRYLQSLPAPRPAAEIDAEGARWFETIGCSGCHRPAFTIDSQTINPYSDFLLHDMGEGLADHSDDSEDTDREWRTAPLWGLSRTLQDKPALLHDGRAGSIIEAILWHGGEAQAARDRFIHLTADKRDALLNFLNQL